MGDQRNRAGGWSGGSGISRRTMLIGGGAGAGLLIAWGVWPRRYLPNVVAAPSEEVLNAFVKIGVDGHVTVIVPQAEMGQGVYTALPQILADELGADWRTVAVEPAPLSPLYANDLLLAEAAEEALPAGLRGIGSWAARQIATRSSLAITGGSTSIRAFEDRFRLAGATARTLLCMAAAERWDVDPTLCDTAEGFVVNGDRRLRFGELAAAAAAIVPPEPILLRGPAPAHSPPRLDMPAKIDGSARYAADVRLPDMVYAAVRHGPHGQTRLAGVDEAAADRIPGMLAVVENPGWVAAVATTWWAANRALDAMHPRFATIGPLPDTASIDAALSAALAGAGTRFTDIGDVEAVFAGGGGLAADYAVPLAVHAAIEPMTATARIGGDRLELWMPTQAAGIARAAAARAIGFAEDAVTVYPMLVGGSFGRKIETEAAEQAALLALRMKRPVQLTWSRAEDIARDRFRPPARARMAARMRQGGQLLGWRARIAAPATFAEIGARLMPGIPAGSGGAEAAAVEGALPPYAIPAVAVDHHPADIGVSTGMWRGVAHSYTAFFTECFIDELAGVAKIEPLSFRMQMLGGARRLAHCLATVTALGGWEGGIAGSGQGIACHSAFGSHAAMLAEVHVGAGGAVIVDRVTAVVDCGRTINDDIVLQQIEGGILWGVAAALGATTGITRGVADARNFDALRLPTLATTPEIVVRIVRSTEPPGGVGELAVPPVAPAIANALSTATGRRHRTLPLSVRS